jgi:hypothetical protein
MPKALSASLGASVSTSEPTCQKCECRPGGTYFLANEMSGAMLP